MANVKKIEIAKSIGKTTGAVYRYESERTDTKYEEERSQSDEVVKETTLDDRIKNENFITPLEYFSKNSSGGSVTDTDGFYNLKDKNTHFNSYNVSWFWVEEFKNWCAYFVNMTTHSSINIFHLYVWNGKDGWMIFDDTPYAYFGGGDRYKIGTYQYKVLKQISANNKIARIRGHMQSVHTEKSGNKYVPQETPENFCSYDQSAIANYFDQLAYMENISGYRLQKNKDYTINMDGTFQTIRWSKLPFLFKTEDFSRFAQTNARFAVPTGAPPIWRLPTGEVFLATVLEWGGDNGNPYYYKKDTAGFRKQYTKSLMGTDSVVEWNMMGPDNIKVAKWINEICRQFFGAGDNKTIDKDWLRLDSDLITVNDNETFGNKSVSLLDSNKIAEQHNINKVNSFKCGFTVNRPVVTSDEIKPEDYAKQW